MAYRTISTFEHSVDGIPLVVQRKNIRNIYLKVDKHTGQVRVSAPILVRKQKIDEFVRKHRSWIRKHQQIRSVMPTQRNGQQYWQEGGRIAVFGSDKVIRIFKGDTSAPVELVGDELRICATGSLSADALSKKIDAFLRSILRDRIVALVQHYEPLMGVKVNEIGIKKMKTRWGTCNIRAGRIWLNAHLIHLQPEITELVVVHEMVHLLEASHNKRFYRLMEQYLPGFKAIEAKLKGKIH